MRSKPEELVNLAFYNPFLGKHPGGKGEIAHRLKIQEQQVSPMQYNDTETASFAHARVFRAVIDEQPFKIRYCRNKEEAESVFARSNYAASLGIPTSMPITVSGTLVVFTYISGRNILPSEAEKHLGRLSEIHAQMNAARFSSDIDDKITESTHNLATDSFSYLSRCNAQASALEKIEKIIARPPRLFAAFDHQDYGIHNILLGNDSKTYVVDEEAFGILPFGYGIVRPLFDRENYRIASNGSSAKYLQAFSKEQQDYFRQNLDYFRALFIVRNAARRMLVGNIKSANRLIEQAQELS